MTMVHLAASSFVGGPESQMLGLIGHWPGASAVLSFSEGGRCRPLLERAARLGAEVVELVENAPNYRASVREIAGHLRRLDARALLCHGYKPDLLGLIAARRAGVPAVSVSHGWTAATLKVRVNEALDRLCLHGMSRVVCVSECQARRVRRIGVSTQKIVVIRNAVDPTNYGPAEPIDRAAVLALFPEGDRPERIVGAAGRLSPEKGFGVLVEAAVEVLRGDPGAGFVHFGDGPLREPLRARVAELGIGRRFVFAGFRADLPRVLPALDLFVLPSFTEGLPCVVLEAFASGVAVVATAVGGTPEVVLDGENGRLVPSGDPHTLAARVVETLNDAEARRAMGDRGRRLVLDRFTFETQAHQYRRLVETLPPARKIGHVQTSWVDRA